MLLKAALNNFAHFRLHMAIRATFDKPVPEKWKRKLVYKDSEAQQLFSSEARDVHK